MRIAQQHGSRTLHRRLAAVTTVFLFLGLATAAFAQSGEPPTLRPPDPNAPGEKPTLPETGEPLSEQLNRSGGVIRPPEQSTPDMRISPPDDPGAGSTPVIPPPGTPGGKPAPVPK